MERAGLRKYVKQQQPRHDRHTIWSCVYQKIRVPAKSWTRLSNFPFTFHFHTLEKEMTTHSSVLACRIPGTGEPGGLLSMGSHRVGHDWSDLAEQRERVPVERSSPSGHSGETGFVLWAWGLQSLYSRESWWIESFPPDIFFPPASR